MKELVVRDDKGRFVPGQSGNPAGKAKGLRNYITHERLMLESALRDYVGKPEQAQKLIEGIERVLTIATQGDDKDAISAMKLLLDRVLPAMPPKLEEEQERTDTRLEIIIRTNPDAKVPVQAVVDGEFTEINEDTSCQTSKPANSPIVSKAEKEPTASTTKATTSSPRTSTRAKAKNPRKKARKKARSKSCLTQKGKSTS